MKWYLKLAMAFFGGVFNLGCQTINQPSTILPDCKHNETKRESIRIRTGGILNAALVFDKAVEDTVTIRQILLESGGIKKRDRMTVLREVGRTLPSPAINELPTAFSSMPADISDLQQLEIVESIFGEAEQSRLKALFVEPGTRPVDVWSPVNAPRVLDPAEYLFLVLKVIKRQADPNLQPQGVWLNTNTRDINELVTTAETLFLHNRSRNPEYVDEVVRKLRSIRSPAKGEATSGLPNTETTSHVADPSQRDQTSRFAIEELGKEELVLIGLLRDGKTNYFHPFLIDHTALGDIILRDKDFVFAIEAGRTSLRSYNVASQDFYIPVSGVAANFNSVQQSTHPTFRNILALVQVDQFTTDSVFILERASISKNTRDTFHLPLAFLGDQVGSVKEVIGDSKVQPGDSVVFTKAFYTPIVRDDFLSQLEQVARRVHEKDPRRLPVQDAVTRSRLVRTASNVAESSRYSARRFANPLAR